ncbi:hypothetical protein KL938_003940 [Ogataea parapolymorpha]|nr:hypothetical protein KL938_003940 [Ogataea parapolymorpha]
MLTKCSTINSLWGAVKTLDLRNNLRNFPSSLRICRAISRDSALRSVSSKPVSSKYLISRSPRVSGYDAMMDLICGTTSSLFPETISESIAARDVWRRTVVRDGGSVEGVGASGLLALEPGKTLDVTWNGV